MFCAHEQFEALFSHGVKFKCGLAADWAGIYGWMCRPGCPLVKFELFSHDFYKFWRFTTSHYEMSDMDRWFTDKHYTMIVWM